MKPIHSVLVFFAIILSSFLASFGSYRLAEASIVADMNKALSQTLAEKRDSWITPDTVQAYRNHLSIAQLKDKSILSYDVSGTENVLCSRQMAWKNNERTILFRSYANCSFMTVFGMSDQRLPLVLSFLGFLWLFLSMRYIRRRTENMLSFGSLSYALGEQQFYGTGHRPLKLTPMQEQLMRMFMHSADHRLTKSDICKALWPKKDDAAETLYTLIRRLKPVIEDNSNVRIAVERGKAYELTIAK